MSTVIVLGGDLNGLVAACLLAKKGKKVRLFETRETLGGISASDPFHTGYHRPGIFHDTARFSRTVAKELALEKYGLQWSEAPKRVLLTNQGEQVAHAPNPGLQQWFQSLKPVIDTLYAKDGPDLIDRIRPLSLLQPGLSVLKAGRKTVMEWSRLMPQCAEDTLEEWETDSQQRALWVLPALFGSYMAPLSPSSTVSLALYWGLLGDQVVGGPGKITEALIKACAALGVDIHTSCDIQQVCLTDGAVTGVRIDGTEHAATQVFSALGVAHTALDLLPPTTLPMSSERRLSHIRSRGNIAKFHCAIEGSIPWLKNKATESTVFQMGGSPLNIERAFDDAKAGRLTPHPAMEIRFFKQATESGERFVLSALVYAVPEAQAKLWDDTEAKTRIIRLLTEHISEHWPEFAKQCVATELLSPRDLRDDYGLPNGHLFHSEWALDQLWAFRPTGALAPNREVVPGLYIAGDDGHGGGALHALSPLFAVRQHT